MTTKETIKKLEEKKVELALNYMDTELDLFNWELEYEKREGLTEKQGAMRKAYKSLVDAIAIIKQTEEEDV